MTMPSANLMENPVKPHKFKNYQKANGMSFAFLFSIVIYISIFYIFSLSPSTLFSNTKFWFVISNTLILIIAADYGAFSSSKDQKRDLYEEYALHSQTRRRSTAASFVPHPEIVTKSIPKEEESLKEKKKEDVADQKKNEIPERIVEVVKIEPKTDNSQAESPQPEHPMKADNEACDQVINKKKIEPKTIRRSKSDKVKRATFDDKNNLQRSKTEKHEPSAKQNEFPAEENEFSTMSDEELNRRVEEFIQNFNRQIRLQGARNRQLLEYEFE
ncbi:uncharacterized protein LOC111318662 [Durio zibethinus]|uniref:Uncharacterized protein LOC111318662 n=1 Tax=Durio zibethinus TaxID=66656 RepID=A0A6P6BJG9_DURZI|nr:uncharacterized protein LOC111318662 [Durio zibethinus]